MCSSRSTWVPGTVQMTDNIKRIHIMRWIHCKVEGRESDKISRDRWLNGIEKARAINQSLDPMEGALSDQNISD